MLRLLLLLVALPAIPATVTLSNGASCTASQVVVTCAGTTTPPPPPPPPPPVPPTAGCPTLPYIPVVLGWTSAPLQQQAASGVVMAFKIPAPTGTKASVRLTQGQMAVSPGGVTEFTVSKCPGLIDPASACYVRTQATNFAVAPDAYTRAVNGWDTQAELTPRRACWAPSAEGQWYVNVRWTYTAACPYGCGYSMQWFPGSY